MKVRRGGMACQSIVLWLLGLSLLGSPAVAQNFRGGIVGSVTDPTGGGRAGCAGHRCSYEHKHNL